jgi:hypothetical protein
MLSNLRTLGRLLLVALALGLAEGSRIALGQNEDAPVENENAPAAIAPGVNMVDIQQGPNLDQMDQWVFGRFGGSGGARNKLDLSLLLRIDDLERTCGISEAQKQKLRLAGRGDIKRFFDKVEEVKRKFQQGKNAPNANIWQEIQPLQVELNTGLFGDDSLYAKTIRRTLSHDQAVRFESVANDRKSFRFRTTVDWFVVHLDKGLGLTESQRQRFIELLVNDAQPPRKFGQGDYWYLMLQTARLPEVKLKPIFDAPQWRLLSGQFAQARSMEQWLKTNGVLADDPKRPGDAAPRIVPAMPPRPVIFDVNVVRPDQSKAKNHE